MISILTIFGMPIELSVVVKEYVFAKAEKIFWKTS